MRRSFLQSKNVAAATTAEKSPAAGGGLLQYFFPGWTGWYGGTNSATPDITGDGNRHAQNNGDSTSVSMVSIESSIPSSQFGNPSLELNTTYKR